MMTAATIAAAALSLKYISGVDAESGSSGNELIGSASTAVAGPAVSNAVASSSLRHNRRTDNEAAAAADSSNAANSAASTNSNTSPPSTSTTTRENIICPYFLQGTCRYGPRCHFSHDVSNVELNDLSEQHEQQQADTATTTPAVNREEECEETPSTSNKIHNKQEQQTVMDKQRLDWANAPVFVPGRYVYVPADDVAEAQVEEEPEEAIATEAVAATSAKACAAPAPTWASIVGGGNASSTNTNVSQLMAESDICPFEGPCPYGHNCIYPVHFELCEMCDQYCLHPSDAEQRRKHKKECLQQHEQAMELSFAIARSKDKTCGICFDTIMEKAGREKRFGILPNCSHIFCLECIRKWRQAKQFEHKITRSCPECRIASDFVCPSAFWVETKEEKDKLLNDYRAALGIKDCKYFKKGGGRCPFGNKCFYKHALPNGDLVDVGLPKRARKVLRSSSETTDLLAIYLWEYVDIRDFQRYNMISIESDNDDDDYMRENFDLSLSDNSTDSDLYF